MATRKVKSHPLIGKRELAKATKAVIAVQLDELKKKRIPSAKQWLRKEKFMDKNDMVTYNPPCIKNLSTKEYHETTDVMQAYAREFAAHVLAQHIEHPMKPGYKRSDIIERIQSLQKKMNTTEELKRDLIEAMRQTIKLPQYADRDSWSAPEMAAALNEQGLLGLNSTLDVRDAIRL